MIKEDYTILQCSSPSSKRYLEGRLLLSSEWDTKKDSNKIGITIIEDTFTITIKEHIINRLTNRKATLDGSVVA